MTKRKKEKQIDCKECGTGFITSRWPWQKFCSNKCREANHYNKPYRNSFERIDGNFRLYLNRLIGKGNRSELNVDDLLRMLKEQNYKCAISGKDLTCTYKKGIFTPTNVSIDRIVPGSEYTIDNVRLVCVVVSYMKWNLRDEDFINWCKDILEWKTQS